jgi:hypothetical protein
LDATFQRENMLAGLFGQLRLPLLKPNRVCPASYKEGSGLIFPQVR